VKSKVKSKAHNVHKSSLNALHFPGFTATALLGTHATERTANRVKDNNWISTFKNP
jgi:hypothetical protein